MTRKSFDHDLEVLKGNINLMAELAISAFSSAIEALVTRDISLAEQICLGDAKINAIDADIEELVVRIIAAQQPVASDLRIIMASLKIAASIERIGDFSVDIAKSVIRLGQDDLVKPLNDIPAMAVLVEKMIRDVIQAYVNLDAAAAEAVALTDDQVDKIYSIIVTDLFKVVLNKPDKTDQIIQLAFISRYIERIADYVTNISEAIIYASKGKRVDMNQ